MDFLHKCADRHLCHPGRAPAAQGATGSNPAPTDGLCRLANPDHRCWRIAGDPRQRQRPGLVRVELHYYRCGDLADRPGGLCDLGNDRSAPGGQLAPVCLPQFPYRHPGADPGLCGVLRHQSDPAPVVTDPDGLHRDLGGIGGGAAGHPAGADVTLCWPVRPQGRPAPAGGLGVPDHRLELLYAGGLHQRGGFPTYRSGAVVHGDRRGAVLHADLEHPDVGPTAAPDCRRRRPGHVPAHARREFRGVADHLDLDSPGGPAPRLPE